MVSFKFYIFVYAQLTINEKALPSCRKYRFELYSRKHRNNKTYRLTQQRFTCEKSTVETLKNRCEICSKLKIKIPEQRQWRSGNFFVNFEYILRLLLVFLLLTLSKKMLPGNLLNIVLHFFNGRNNPAGIYLIKINNGSTRNMREICLKSTRQTHVVIVISKL